MTTAADPKTSGRFERRERPRQRGGVGAERFAAFLDRVPQLREAGDSHQTLV